MKKLLVIGVIGLFLGLVCAPSINANVSRDDELVEITTEICGLGGGKQTVQLTQKEAEEVDRLLESVRLELNKSTSREEAVEIFNDAIVELNKYGLLCGLSVKQTQKIFNVYNAVQWHSDIGGLSENENAFCMIAGRITRSFIIGPITYSLLSLLSLDSHIWNISDDSILFAILFLSRMAYIFALDTALMNGYPFSPLRLSSSIIVGTYWEYMLEGGLFPSDGWIWTIGSNGIKIWNGEFIGKLDNVDVSLVAASYLFRGVKGFFGIQIHNLKKDKTSFLGFARRVNIEYS
jgi:hypothetical protein